MVESTIGHGKRMADAQTRPLAPNHGPASTMVHKPYLKIQQIQPRKKKEAAKAILMIQIQACSS